MKQFDRSFHLFPNSERGVSIHLSWVNTLESWLLGLSFGCLALGIAGLVFFFFHYHERMYPGVIINAHDVSGLSYQEARELLTKEYIVKDQNSIVLHVKDQRVASTAAQLDLHYDFDQALDQAYAIGRHQSLAQRIFEVALLPWRNHYIPLELSYDRSALTLQIEHIARLVDQPHSSPSATLIASGVASSLEIEPGVVGNELDVDEAITKTQNHLKKMQPPLSEPITINLEDTIASVGAQLTPEQISEAETQASKLVGISLTVSAQDLTHQFTDQDLIASVAFPNGFYDEVIQKQLDILETIVNRSPQEPVFKYNPENLTVEEFVPPRNGLELQRTETKEALVQKIKTFLEEVDNEEQQISTSPLSLEIITTSTPPETSLAETNDLGIKELIGSGDSEYAHSIPNRVHNVAHTAERINNTIVPPGEQFSFNKTLGEVSSRTGFRSAYVIKNGRTELGDGGGVCQVSTTLFRAALDTGLDVTKRLQHSYRVGYYEQNSKPGLDATVYAGDIDFKFINDTDHHILIHNTVDSENRYLKTEIFGTSDGRTTEITEHEVWGATPPPPPQYYDDSSLPTGVIKQVDWAVSGIKTRVLHVVRDKDGNLMREDEYYSNYVPWSAKYIRGV